MNHTSQKSNSPRGAGLLYRAGRRKGTNAGLLESSPGETSARLDKGILKQKSQGRRTTHGDQADGLGFGDCGGALDAAGLEGLGPCSIQLQGVPWLVQCMAYLTTHGNPIFLCSLLDELGISLMDFHESSRRSYLY